MQFILPRAIQCSSGTTKASKTQVLPQSVLPTPRESPRFARCWVCWGSLLGCTETLPSPSWMLQDDSVSPALGDWGLSSPRAHWKAETGEIHFCRALPSCPQQHPKSSPSGHSKELQAHLCLQHSPAIRTSSWGNGGAALGSAMPEQPGEGPWAGHRDGASTEPCSAPITCRQPAVELTQE